MKHTEKNLNKSRWVRIKFLGKDYYVQRQIHMQTSWILFELVWTCFCTYLFIYLLNQTTPHFFRQNTKVKFFVRPKAWENFSNSRWISESKLLFIFSTSSLPNWDVIIMDQYFGHFINHTGENKIFLSQQRKVIYSVIWKQMLSQLEII